MRAAAAWPGSSAAGSGLVWVTAPDGNGRRGIRRGPGDPLPGALLVPLDSCRTPRGAHDAPVATYPSSPFHRAGRVAMKSVISLTHPGSSAGQDRAVASSSVPASIQAGGLTGRRVVRELVAAQHHVTAGTRTVSDATSAR